MSKKIRKMRQVFDELQGLALAHDEPVMGHDQYQRAATINGPTDERTIVQSLLSTEQPVSRNFGMEVLSHAPGAMDLSRAPDGVLPLNLEHNKGDQKLPIGMVRNIKVADGVMRGDVTLADTDRGNEALELYRTGVPVGLSVGYVVDFRSAVFDDDTGNVVFNRWYPIEVSATGIAADSSVALGRSHEGQIMIGKDKPGASAGEGVIDFDTRFERARSAGAADGAAAERDRQAGIREVFSLPAIPPSDPLYRSLELEAVNNEWSVERTQREVLTRLGRSSAPTTPAAGAAPAVGAGHVQAGEDGREKFATAATAVLMLRSGVDTTDATREVVRQSGLGAASLLHMARSFLQVTNNPMMGSFDPQEITSAAFMARAGGGHTVSDFTNILANVASKSLLLGWQEQEETWRQIARVGNLSDFKISDRDGLSEFSNLDQIGDDGEIKSGTLSDYKEQIQLAQYAKKFRLTRKTIINDDMGAFSTVPRKMGRAASRKIGDLVYDTLYSNSGVGPTLNQDDVALFNAASHNNYVASGSAPTVATLDTAFTAMATHTDTSANAPLSIRPKTLLVPWALSATARTLVAAEKDPSVASGESPNPFYNRLTVVEESRLELTGHGASATRWYLVADPIRNDVCEVAFLNGDDAPYLREQEEWGTRGVEWVVGVDAGVAFLDYRGIYNNNGA